MFWCGSERTGRVITSNGFSKNHNKLIMYMLYWQWQLRYKSFQKMLTTGRLHEGKIPLRGRVFVWRGCTCIFEHRKECLLPYTLFAQQEWTKKILTPSLAWLWISRRFPDELYRGVAVSVGGLGAAQKIHLHSCKPSGKKLIVSRKSASTHKNSCIYNYKSVDTSVTTQHVIDTPGNMLLLKS